MALDPSARYPSQIDADTDYPYGKARNVAVDGDGTGTPLEKDWVNDLFGFEQALLDAASITPSGDPDSVAASDYLDAIQFLDSAVAAAAAAATADVAADLVTAIAERHGARYSLSGTTIAQGSKYTLSLEERSDTDYALASNEITVPEGGWYLITLQTRMQNDDTSNPRGIAAGVQINGVTKASAYATRFSATASHVVGMSTQFVYHITTPASEKISVVELSGAGNGSIVTTAERALSIVRIA